MNMDELEYYCFMCNGKPEAKNAMYICAICKGKGVISLKPIKRALYSRECPECHKGQLVATCVLTTDPPKYEYTCNECGYRVIK